MFAAFFSAIPKGVLTHWSTANFNSIIYSSFWQVLVSDGTDNIIPLVSLGSNQHATAVFMNTSSVFQENTAYTIQVSCVNKGGYESDPILTEFHIESSPPVHTGKITIS